MEIVFATGNVNKVREVQGMLPQDIAIMSLKSIGCLEEIPEDQDTIEGNSTQKAQYVYKNYGSDCFAEDTGLEVEALNGAPGVLSARYAGKNKNNDENMLLLLKNLQNIENRKARFKTVITLILKGKELQFEGILNGEIGLERRGCNGFGYDPIFITEDGRTLAEMSFEEKIKISHRSKAVKKLVNYLTNL